MKVSIDLPKGQKLSGTYEISEDGRLTLTSRLGTKTARIGAFTPQNLAKFLLNEQIITANKGTK